MKNLARHRLAFSVLMMCVLMFGVQGSADAITKFTKSSSTDYQVRSINEPFTISFSISAQSQASIKDATTGRLTAEDGTIFIDSSGYPGTYVDHDSNADTPDRFTRTPGADRVSNSLRYHYNDEAIGISVTRNGAALSATPELTLRRSGTSIPLVGSTRVSGIPTDTSASLYESAENSNRRLSGSLTGVATTHGVYTITINDITSTDDTPDGYTVATPITFTIYVWRNVSTSRGATISTGIDDDIAEEFGTQPLSVTLDYSSPPTGHGSDYAKVEFEVTRGPGTLYEDKDGDGKPDKSASKRLTTFTNNLGTANVVNVILMPNRGTSHIRVWVSGNAPDPTKAHTDEAIYSYGFSQLKKVSGDLQTGPASSRLEDPFVVQLVDSTGSTTIPGATITFTPSGGSTLVKDPSFPSNLYPTDFPTAADTAGTVTTDSNGRASVFLVLGTTDDASVTTTFSGDTSGGVTFTASVGDVATDDRNPTTINILRETDGQRANQYGQLDKPLTVIVRDQYGDRHPGVVVEFEERDGGVVSNPKSTDPGTVPTTTTTPTLGNSDATDRRRDIITDASGEASVRYLAAEKSGRQRVTATLQDGSRRSVTFTINGTPSSTSGTGGTGGTTTTSPTPTLTLSSSTLTGTASSNVPLAATVRNAAGNTVQGIGVSFTLSTTNSGAILTPTAITNANGVAQTNIVLPNTNATVTATATVGGVSLTQQASITVTDATADTGTGTGGTDGQVTAVPESITISGSSSFTGEANVPLSDPLAVRILDTNGVSASGETVFFSIIEGRGRLSPGRTRTDRDGYAEVTFTPLSSGTITVQAASGDLSPVTFTITTGEPPAAIVLVSGNNQSGRPSERLANPFIVEVVDANDDPVSGVTVTFAVTAGGGTLSTTTATTNGTGRAQTYLRLGDEVGENTVDARVTGLTAVTFTAISGAEVLVSAAQRPPLYWISRTEGKLHRLVGEEVENLAPNIDNILSLTVDTQNQLLYWTRQTAQSKSAIQRAGLNGRGVITLQTSLTLMTSIAVDSTGTTLYWADILGKIKSRPVQGNRVTLLAQNLSSPTGLVWANEYLYWGEATGQIRRMNLRNNRRTIETITTSSGEPVSLAVRSGRVYWTEISGNAAQLNRVNTNGTGLEALKTLTGSRRVWLDVDGSSSKIYLTRASKLERRNLSGQSTVTLVTGLQSPGSLVLGGELVATPPVVSQPTQPTQPTDNSKYDVNGDGTVDLLDVIAPLVQPNNMKNDVNGDGVVDIRDTQEIDANRDATAAAPSLDIDVKALDLDFDRVQEQIETLLTSGDRSIAAQRALLYLQHLLASARPDETVLLANYPNPFNPETWIPYHLAESTDVRVNIYDAQGVLVRVLPLGHQTAGYYTSRSRAAYWDGLNALGERVASGIYFYQLQTDAVSPMRKMVILK